MVSALDGFLEEECDAALAGHLRAEVAATDGHGYDHFEFNLIDLDLYYAEGRVSIVQAVSLQGKGLRARNLRRRSQAEPPTALRASQGL